MRTRKDLLEAGARLMKQGLSPTFEEVAAEAMVSRATAYRYFPNVEALLLEASLDVAFPDPRTFFAEDGAADVLLRLDRMDAAVEEMILANETALRTMVAQSLQRGLKGGDQVPARQNRRLPLIEAALAPERGRLDPRLYDRLGKALALVVGTEARLVFKDVLRLPDAEAREVRRWAIRALLDAARRGSA
jgi:AcrR family transcriptional regulator